MPRRYEPLVNVVAIPGSTLHHLQRVLQHKEESALLKAYIAEWTKYFTQCDYLPKPFQAMEMEGTNNKPKKRNQEGNRVQLVGA